MKKTFSLLLVIVLFCTTISGCWGKRELDEIGIVMATGIDIEPNGDFRMTVISIQPVQTTQISGEKSNAWIGTATGKSVMEASKNLRRTAMRRLVWFHNRVIVLSQEVAKTRLKDVVGFFTSNQEIRLDSYILISEKRVEDIFQIPADIELNLAGELEGIIENADEWSKAYPSNLKDFLITLTEEKEDTLTARLEYHDTSRSTYSTSREMYVRNSMYGVKLGIIAMSGSAVIKGCKMVGWMDEEETRGYMWITGKVKPGTTIVRASDDQGFLTCEVVSSNSKIKTQVDGNTVIVNIDVEAAGRIVEQSDGADLMSEESIKRYEQSFAKLIENEMKISVQKAQKGYQADIFGFGDDIFKRHPEIWRQMENEWEKVYPDLEVRYNVEVTIKRIGLILNPLLD